MAETPTLLERVEAEITKAERCVAIAVDTANNAMFTEQSDLYAREVAQATSTLNLFRDLRAELVWLTAENDRLHDECGACDSKWSL